MLNLRRGALVVAVVTALTAPLTGAPPAAASHQSLAWNEDGASFRTFRGGADIVIYDGRIEFACDSFYPTASVYIVPTGSVGDGATLTDVGGAPNVVFGASGGYFGSELIGRAGWNGITPGRYAVVYDECQDGKFQADEDALFDPAFEVLPTPVGSISPALEAAKASAYLQALAVDLLNDSLDHYEQLKEAKQKLDCLMGGVHAIATCAVEYALDEAKSALEDELRAYLGVTDPKEAAKDLVSDMVQHYYGIAADPPDPDFRRLDLLRPVADVRPETGDALAGGSAALGRAAAGDGALAEAFLRAVERYQGAQGAGDAQWALVHARSAQTLAARLADRLPGTAAATRELRAAVAADPTDLDALARRTGELRGHLQVDGFSRLDLAELAGAGVDAAEASALRTAVLAQPDPSSLTRAGLLDALDGAAAEADASVARWRDTATRMGALAADLVAAGAPDAHPRAVAGGPYTVAEGSGVALDGSASRDPEGGALTYAWDLDGDGAFDDATGARPTATPAAAGSRLVGLQVTDPTGLRGVSWAVLDVTEAAGPPSLGATSPAASAVRVTEGEAAAFTAAATDPDGDPVALTWHLWPGGRTATGPSFAFTPPAGSAGPHTLRVTASDGTAAGGSVSRTWAVTVVPPDADGDGWPVGPDCDDTAAAVHPAAAEVPGNGRDDDCDPATSDAGGPPVADFRPDGSGGRAGYALLEAGATVAATSGTDYHAHTPEAMLDFGAGGFPWAASGPAPFTVVDLVGDRPVLLDRVAVMPRPDYRDQRVKAFAVDVSLNGTSFTEVLRATTADDPTLQEFALAEPVDARFLRYRPLTSHGRSGIISTQQLRAYGPQSGGSAIVFTSRSTDPEGGALDHAWDFGDGTTSTDAFPRHVFPGPGTYRVRLTVTDPGGQSATVERDQRVLAPPAVTLTLPPSTPEGATVTATSTVTAAPGRTVRAAQTSWGEGSATGLTYAYLDDGTFTVTREAIDSAGDVGSASATITVTNAPPLVDLGPDRGWVGGEVLNFAPVSVTDPGRDALSCSWDYGDGSPPTAPSPACQFSHVYAHTAPWGSGTPALPRTATLTVTDDDGGRTTRSVVIAVRPDLVESPDNLVGNGDFRRPAGYGPRFPGSTALAPWTVEPNSVDTLPTSFADAASGAQSIDVNGNARGALHQDVRTVPGQAYRLRYAVAGNIEGPATVRRLQVSWGGVALAEEAFDTRGRSRRDMGWRYSEHVVRATASTTRLRFASLAEGVYGPLLDDVSLLPTTDVPLGPVVAAGPDATLDEGGTFALAPATFTDSSGSRAHSATVSWGDGTTSEGVVDEAAGTVRASHRYLDDGVHTVRVCVTAGNGERGCDELVLTVVNVAPTAYAGVDVDVLGGLPHTQTGTGADPGADPLTCTWDPGDGSTPRTGCVLRHQWPEVPPGSAPVAHTATLTVDDGDGGRTTDTVVVTVHPRSPDVDTDVFYTRFSGGENVRAVGVRYGASGFALGAKRTVARTHGADGVIFGPDGDLLIGGQGDRVHKVDPTTGAVETRTAGGTSAFHIGLDPDRRRAWTGGLAGALAEIPLVPFSDGQRRPLSGSDGAVTHVGFDGNGAGWYTASGAGGFGAFGRIDLTTFRTTRLFSGLEPAHGMSWDPYTNSFLLFGGSEIAQIDVSNPAAPRIVSRLRLAGANFDQGAADGLGRAYVASNDGRLLFVDYSHTREVGAGGNYVSVQYLDSSLDDVAPLSGLGALPPTAEDVTARTVEDTPVEMTLRGAASRGAPLTYRITAQPAHGGVVPASPGSATVTYTPEPGFSGRDTFTYVAVEAGTESEPATVTVDVEPGDAPPVLGPLADVTLAEGEVLHVRVSATDPDGDRLTLAVADLPSWADFVDHGDGHGLLSLRPTYSDASDRRLPVTATAGGATTSGTLRVVVTDVPPPTVADSTASTDEDTAVPVPLRSDDTATSYRVLVGPAHGTLAGTAPELVYTPAPDWSGEDAFTWTASSPAGTSAVATVRVTVRPVADAPVLVPLPDTVLDEGTEAVVALAASDADGDRLTFALTGPAYAVLEDAGDGTGRVVLRPGFTDAGTTQIRVVVSDGALTDADTGAVTVRDVNRAPRAVLSGGGSVVEGGSASLSAADSSDPDGDVLTYAWDLDGDGQHDDGSGPTATVPAVDDGVVPVSVRVTDPGDLTATATGTVTVTNAAPVVTAVVADRLLAGRLARGSSLAATFTDAGVRDTHRAEFRVGDEAPVTADPYASGARVPAALAAAGCAVAVRATVTDDDGGVGTSATTVGAGSGGFLPPLSDDEAAHRLTPGQVLPVKVAVTDCDGVERTDLSPAIRVVRGDGVTAGGATSGDEQVPSTRAASQQHGVMRRNGNHYHYDLVADLAPGTWTVVVYPYGAGAGMPSLRHLLDVASSPRGGR